MSVTKTKTTQYHEDEQAVRFALKWLRLNSLNDLKALTVRGGLSGRVGNAPGEVDYKESVIRLGDIKENCTATEKTTLKKAIAIFERELARVEDELSSEDHDASDVFVDNS